MSTIVIPKTVEERIAIPANIQRRVSCFVSAFKTRHSDNSNEHSDSFDRRHSISSAKPQEELLNNFISKTQNFIEGQNVDCTPKVELIPEQECRYNK